MNSAVKIILALTVLALIGLAVFFVLRPLASAPTGAPKKIIVEEKLVIPDTVRVSAGEGRTVQKGSVDAPINPSEGEIVSAKAVFTIKGAYDKASVESSLWAPDAALVFIKSLGVVTGEGKSGEWQIVLGSKEKKSGYEIIVYGDSVASKKEIPSTSFGFDLPHDWYDSGDALASLRTEPQFENATVSSLSFFYNEDAKRWSYALATSNGTLSMPVK